MRLIPRIGQEEGQLNGRIRHPRLESQMEN